jgi:hypothetical protein
MPEIVNSNKNCTLWLLSIKYVAVRSEILRAVNKMPSILVENRVVTSEKTLIFKL